MCECEYGITTINGECVLVIKQTSNSTTSITNVFETIVSKILASDLFGKNPENIRIFEYYPPSLAPIQVWQEVKFKNAYEIHPNMSLIDKLKQLLVTRKNASCWAVDSPVWSLIWDENLKSQLNFEAIN